MTIQTSLSGSIPYSASGQAPAEPRSRVQTPVRTLGPTLGQDTVKLSVAAQITQLARQGVSASEIANTLGLTTSLVNSYLLVPLTTAATQTASATTAAGA